MHYQILVLKNQKTKISKLHSGAFKIFGHGICLYVIVCKHVEDNICLLKADFDSDLQRYATD